MLLSKSSRPRSSSRLWPRRLTAQFCRALLSIDAGACITDDSKMLLTVPIQVKRAQEPWDDIEGLEQQAEKQQRTRLQCCSPLHDKALYVQVKKSQEKWDDIDGLKQQAEKQQQDVAKAEAALAKAQADLEGLPGLDESASQSPEDPDTIKAELRDLAAQVQLSHPLPIRRPYSQCLADKHSFSMKTDTHGSLLPP